MCTPHIIRAPRPWLARLVTPAGPPRTAIFRHGKSAILALPGRFSVSYLLVEGQDVVIVDCSSTADLGAVGRALSWLGRTRDDARYVLPTHLHFDHILGLDPLANRLGTSVALGEVADEHVHRGRQLHWPRRRRLLRALPTWPMQGLRVFTQADWRQGDFGYLSLPKTPYVERIRRLQRFPPSADPVAHEQLSAAVENRVHLVRNV